MRVRCVELRLASLLHRVQHSLKADFNEVICSCRTPGSRCRRDESPSAELSSSSSLERRRKRSGIPCTYVSADAYRQQNPVTDRIRLIPFVLAASARLQSLFWFAPLVLVDRIPSRAEYQCSTVRSLSVAVNQSTNTIHSSTRLQCIPYSRAEVNLVILLYVRTFL